ncbi:MAG: hypothetical protein IJH04_00390 [Eggerthellaceae bacterium]|nr:hypothetical protein [Eggerthellaceae bacterium]
MNSEERREARRSRREERRAEKKAARNEGCTLEKVADLNSLYKAQREAARGVAWKGSTQRYQLDWLLNIARARRDILEGNEICRGFHEFDLYERGKMRHISSVHFSERVVQKSITQNAYVPAISPSFIFDNSANLKGRGTHFALKRVKEAMARHYRLNGPDGYVLQIDFKSYFASIAHQPVKDIIAEHIVDGRIVALGHHFIDVQGEVGLGLGSEPNQILAVGLPTSIDHMVSECCGLEYYGRYMDDSIAMDADKEALRATLALIRDRCRLLGIEVNERKTHIVKLSHGFTFLKTKFSYSETGKVVMRPCRDSITRERRKLKAHSRMVADGILTHEQAVQSYQSWRGSKLHIDAHGAVLRIDALFAQRIGAMKDPPQVADR